MLRFDDLTGGRSDVTCRMSKILIARTSTSSSTSGPNQRFTATALSYNRKSRATACYRTSVFPVGRVEWRPWSAMSAPTTEYDTRTVGVLSSEWGMGRRIAVDPVGTRTEATQGNPLLDSSMRTLLYLVPEERCSGARVLPGNVGIIKRQQAMEAAERKPPSSALKSWSRKWRWWMWRETRLPLAPLFLRPTQRRRLWVPRCPHSLASERRNDKNNLEHLAETEKRRRKHSR